VPMYYIKISGIWENATEIGITYKIIEHYPRFATKTNAATNSEHAAIIPV
jgi:hypothetical protein